MPKSQLGGILYIFPPGILWSCTECFINNSLPGQGDVFVSSLKIGIVEKNSFLKLQK